MQAALRAQGDADTAIGAIVVPNYLPTSHHISLHLPESPYISPIGEIVVPTASVSCIEYEAGGPAGGRLLFCGRKPEALGASSNDLTGAS